MILNIYNRLNRVTILYCTYWKLYYSELHPTTENERALYSTKVIIEMRFKETTNKLKAVDVIVDCYVR